MSDQPIKAVRQGYNPSPFFYPQINAAGHVRLVGWTANASQLQALFRRLTNELPEDVEILLKIRREEETGDRYDRFAGRAAKADFVRAVESFPGVVFHDSQNQVCVRDPATAEHIVVDEEGVVFVYSDDERFRRAFVETGFDERIEPLISEEGRWNYTPPDSAVARRLFIDQLRLEPVEMDLFMRVRQILSEYPRVSISDGSDWLKVHAADASGFSVWLSKSSSGFTVSFDGWHEEFSARRDALDCFLFGLSPSCRLHVTLRGTVPTKWRAEALSDGEWVATSSTGLFLQPFWRRVRIEYRQNQFLAPSTPEAVIRFRNLIAKSYS